MEEKPPFNLLLFVSLVALFAFLAIDVESQQQQQQQQPPQHQQQPPSPSPLPLPLPHHSPPPRRQPHPPHLHESHSPPKSPIQLNPDTQLNQHKTQRKRHRLNDGQKVGLLFAGIVTILQVGVVGFLAFKRRQLLKMRD